MSVLDRDTITVARQVVITVERPEPSLVQQADDEAVTGAVAAAAAAVGEHHDADGLFGEREVPGEADRAGLHLDLFVACPQRSGHS